jgi:hypothetical protein
MMKWILFLFAPLLSLKSEESVISLSQQAEALWEAHDYAAASKIYEQLLLRPLPAWQNARVLYNLGTISLAQYQIVEALAFFKKIYPVDLALPNFGRDFFLNTGIAYFRYAQTLALNDPSSFELQALFIKQSLKAFDQAHQLECQMQEEEQKESPFACHSSPLVNEWLTAARLQFHIVHQKKRQQWIKQASIESLASFLQDHLQEWIDRFNTIQNEKKKPGSSFASYFQHQAESFIPIWNALQQKEFSLNQKIAFDQALALYLSALNQQNLENAAKDIQQGIDSLTPLAFQDNKDLQQAYLSYQMLFMQELLTVSAIHKVLAQVDALKVAKDQAAALEHIKENLRKSLEEQKANHEVQARFFLLAGFSQMHSLFKGIKSESTIILQQAIEQANHALQLFFLSQMMPIKSAKQAPISSILKDQQHDVLLQAAPFIPAVLQEQTLHFQHAKNPANRCQQSPWDQVIPLFDRGYRAAQNADTQFSKASLEPQIIIANQEQTIKSWQQALNLILHPPLQHQAPSSASAPQNLTKTFRLIQEMYLEDQAPPKQKTQELHSW